MKSKIKFAVLITMFVIFLVLEFIVIFVA